MLPPKPSPRGLRVTQTGNSKPSDGARKNLPCWLTPQAPTSSWGKRRELAARLAHLRSPGKVEAEGTAPPFKKGASSPGVLPLSEQENASCQRVKGHKGLSWLGRCSAWRCRTRTLPQSGAVQTLLRLLRPETGGAEPTGGQLLLLRNPKAPGLCRP